jgi:NADH-quinone oxidoreductase subunit J
MTTLPFLYIAAALVVLSVLVVTRKNPVHAAILMILMFFHLAALYIFLGAEFLAAVQIIVYAGAILVLFLFVVMVLNIREETFKDRFVGVWPLGLVLAAGLFVLISVTTGSLVLGAHGTFTPQALAAETHTKALGRLLYTDYVFPFELASLILLVAMIGAIVLAKKKMR